MASVKKKTSILQLQHRGAKLDSLREFFWLGKVELSKLKIISIRMHTRMARM